jgi:hypothetical protein
MGVQGPAGATGATGPQGVQGIQGPAGTPTVPLVFNRTLANDILIPTTQQYVQFTIDELTTTFTISEPRALHVSVNALIDRGGNIKLTLDDVPIGAEWRMIFRMVPVQPGQHTLKVIAETIGGSRIVARTLTGIPSAPYPATYLDAVVQ